MNILSIRIKQKESMTDSFWLGEEVSKTPPDSIELSDSFFSVMFTNENYYLVLNKEQKLINDSDVISAGNYLIQFENGINRQEKIYHTLPFAKDPYRHPRKAFSMINESKDPNDKLNFLYAGLNENLKRNSGKSNVFPIPYKSKQSDNEFKPRKIQRLTNSSDRLSTNMIRNALRLIKIGKN